MRRARGTVGRRARETDPDALLRLFGVIGRAGGALVAAVRRGCFRCSVVPLRVSAPPLVQMAF